MNRAAMALLCGLLLACDPGLSAGELGQVRYFANVGGEVPLALQPPISDRSGNAYVLYGDPNETEAQVWVAHASGGFTSSCKVVAGTSFGVHGWVGRTQDKAYYWAGGALVSVSGKTGSCKQMLKRDPSSGANLEFLAVVPWVEDAPSRTRAVGWVQSPTDTRPFQVAIDLRVGSYTSVQDVGKEGRSEYEVLGVGADGERGTGAIVYRYSGSKGPQARGRIVGMDAATIEDVSVEGAEEIPAYGILGTLVPLAENRFAGVSADGRLLILDADGGRFRNIKGLEPVGAHRWKGQTFLVGTRGDEPVISALDETGAQGEVLSWGASIAADATIRAAKDVRDDRALPSTTVTWKSPRSAIGPYAFLAPTSLDSYASDTTLWLVAGPDYEAGGETRTAVALVPVGVTYP